MSAGRAEMRKFVRQLEKQGFTVARTGSGHWKVTRPGREGSVVMGFSPNITSLHKTKIRLKKLGYKEGG